MNVLVQCSEGLFDKLKTCERMHSMMFFFGVCICDGEFLKVIAELLSLLLYYK